LKERDVKMSGKNKSKTEFRVSGDPQDAIWVNASKTGRGATIALNGGLYVAPISALRKLVDGETKGAKFSKVIKF